MGNTNTKKKKKKTRINQLTEKQKFTGLAIVVGVIILSLIVINLLIPSPDSKFVFMKSECDISGEVPAGDADLQKITDYYKKFSLYGENNSFGKFKYVSHEEVTYYINNITGERISAAGTSAEGNYTEFTELICTLRMKDSMYGPLKNGEKIEIYFAPSEKDMAKALIDNKNIYVSVLKSERSEGRYELSHGLDGVFFVKDEKILPACDVTPAEYHKALALGDVKNPLMKYKGMTESQFRRAIKKRK